MEILIEKLIKLKWKFWLKKEWIEEEENKIIDNDENFFILEKKFLFKRKKFLKIKIMEDNYY